jgi:hypothetical protein
MSFSAKIIFIRVSSIYFTLTFWTRSFFFIYVQGKKPEMYNIEDSARTESKGSSEVGKDAVYGR